MNTDKHRLFPCCCIVLTLCVHLCLSEAAISSASAQSGRKPPQKPGEQQPKPGEAPIVKIETREVSLPLRAYAVIG